MLEIARQSRVTIAVPVTTVTELGAPADPTADPVDITFSLTSSLADDMGDWDHPWIEAAWLVTDDGELFATRMIGPDGLTPGFALEPGVWWPFVRPNDSPEVPVLRGKPFRIY